VSVYFEQVATPRPDLRQEWTFKPDPPIGKKTRAACVTRIQTMTTQKSQSFPRQFAGLFYPGGELGFVELVVLVDVEVAHFLLPGLAGRDGTQRSAAEEGHLYVFREDMEAEEPALAFDAVERRVVFDSLVYGGDGVGDEGIEPVADFAFPARHCCDIGLHGRVAVGLCDLGVAA
jgi:hypothetical protein